jgi:hypothetical protein
LKIRLYLDEDSMDRDLVRALKARAIDVLSALEAGMVERPDVQHLEYAASEERVLYSFNVGDFYHLHTSWLSEGRSHCGLILSKQQQYSAGEQMRRLLKLIATRSPEEMRDRVEFLSAWD